MEDLGTNIGIQAEGVFKRGISNGLASNVGTEWNRDYHEETGGNSGRIIFFDHPIQKEA